MDTEADPLSGATKGPEADGGPGRSRLARRTALLKQDRQSSGPLYDLFLSSSGGRLYKWHHYLEILDRHLARFRGTAPRILEVGLGLGGSSRMWLEYFGLGTSIVGIDVSPYCLSYQRSTPGLTVRIGDQADTEFLASITAEFGSFDIILDVGGHTARQQLNTFKVMYPDLADNGVLVCEDTHTSFYPEYLDAGPDVSMIRFAQRMVDRLYEPYFGGGHFERYGTPPLERQGSVTVSAFAAMTYGIYFHDSIVVFEKRPRAEPYHELR